MNLLLDTHVALWAITASPRLKPEIRRLVSAPGNNVWISAVTVWEIAIKHSLGKAAMPISGTQALAYFREAGYGLLPIAPEHAAAVGELPAHHHDPFDRLLIAQALQEPMRLVSHDDQVLKYSDNFIAA